MAEVTANDLNQPERTIGDVLHGEDTALPLVEACSSGDGPALKHLLSQPRFVTIALEKPVRIHHKDARRVLSRPISNLEHIITTAAGAGHADEVSTLLAFADQQGVTPSSVVTRKTIEGAILHGSGDVLKVLASAYPEVANFPLLQGAFPLDLAIQRCKTDAVAALLEFGADPSPQRANRRKGSYRSSLLSLAARSCDIRMIELLLDHGHPILQSGALHSAAEVGRLDKMQLLKDRGADVDERLPEDGLPLLNRELLASWTPMHFAASKGQVEAMRLLERSGARSDVKDANGRTAAQLLNEHN